MRRIQLLRVRTPFGRMKYQGTGGICTRPFRVALRCWWSWDVLPWFTKANYKLVDGEKHYKYRWQGIFKKI